MNAMVINSQESLQTVLGQIRSSWESSKYLRVTVKTGKDRSLPQNSFSHAWYEQLARELNEDDALGWKAYCKLHHGVPLLRAEDEEFRKNYDASLKGLTYEQKLMVMRYFPVTSLMTKKQLSKYAEAIQQDFAARGVHLEFPQ